VIRLPLPRYPYAAVSRILPQVMGLTGLCFLLPITALADPTLSNAALSSATTPQALLDAAPYTLRLNTSCTSSITIEGASEGQGDAALLEDRDGGQMAGLTIAGSGHETTVDGNQCERASTLHVRQGTAIIASMRGFGSLHISGVNGPVSLTQRGSGTISIDQATALVLNENGFGSLRLGWLNGPATLTTAGSGSVTIARVDASHLAADSGGFGSITLNAGTIGALNADIHGSGHLKFGGTVGTANLVASGYGGIDIDRVTGELHQEAHSPATISLNHASTFRKSAHARDAILTLPDGTVITAHSLTRPDGTVISFDNDESGDRATAGDDATPRHGQRRWLGWGLLALLLIVFRRRIAGFVPVDFLSRVRRSVGSSHAPQPLAASAPEIATLEARLQRLDKRVSDIEQCVTSRNFHLHREFHHLARNHG